MVGLIIVLFLSPMSKKSLPFILEQRLLRNREEEGSPIKVLVVPTDEELEIVRQTVEAVKSRGY
jgi:hypothetical protein